MLGIFKILLLAMYVISCGTAGHPSYQFPRYITCENISQHPSWPLLKNQDCGKARNVVTSRIMSGEDANLAEFPWMALLVFKNRFTNSVQPRCGGSIISEKYVLTAAHCCFDNSLFKLEYVTLGDYEKYKEPDCVDGRCAPPTLNITIEQVIIHSKYDRQNSIHDICLLRLKEKISFTEFVSPICLPTSCELMSKQFDGMKLDMAGWGKSSYTVGMNSPVLQKGKNKVISPLDCYILFNHRIFTHTIGPSQICTIFSHATGGRPCDGDSGSPLMYRNRITSKGYIIGLLSFGRTCDPWVDGLVGLIPDVYSRVDYYLPWILDNIKD